MTALNWEHLNIELDNKNLHLDFTDLVRISRVTECALLLGGGVMLLLLYGAGWTGGFWLALLVLGLCFVTVRLKILFSMRSRLLQQTLQVENVPLPPRLVGMDVSDDLRLGRDQLAWIYDEIFYTMQILEAELFPPWSLSLAAMHRKVETFVTSSNLQKWLTAVQMYREKREAFVEELRQHDAGQLKPIG